MKKKKNVTLKYVSQEKKITCIVYTMYSVVGQDLHLKMVPYRQIISIALFIYCNSIYRDYAAYLEEKQQIPIL
jgi:hypothetical protein